MDQGAAEDVEALRRRLYAPGATDGDRARFAALVRDAAPAETPSAEVAAPPHRRRIGRRGVLAGVAVLVLAVGGIALLRPPGPPARPVAAPAVLDVSAADRIQLADRLRAGGVAGIAAWLVVNRAPRGLAGREVTGFLEDHGSGSGVLRLDRDAPRGAGRATVLVVLGEDSRVVWDLQRLATDGETPVVHLQSLAVRGGQQQAGSLTSTTVPYADGRRPVRLEVDAPAGVAWGAAVVFSG